MARVAAVPALIVGLAAAAWAGAMVQSAISRGDAKLYWPFWAALIVVALVAVTLGISELTSARARTRLAIVIILVACAFALGGIAWAPSWQLGR